MKTTGTCPKCKSTNILIYESPISSGGRVATVYNPIIKISTFKSAGSTRYICRDCGYSELYFDTTNLKYNN